MSQIAPSKLPAVASATAAASDRDRYFGVSPGDMPRALYFRMLAMGLEVSSNVPYTSPAPLGKR